MATNSPKRPDILSPDQRSCSLSPAEGTEGDTTESSQVSLSPGLSPSVPRQDGPLSPNPPTKGWGQGTAQGTGVRAEFARRRRYGLVRRHAAKMRHFAEHGMPEHLAVLVEKVTNRAAARAAHDPNAAGPTHGSEQK